MAKATAIQIGISFLIGFPLDCFLSILDFRARTVHPWSNLPTEDSSLNASAKSIPQPITVKMQIFALPYPRHPHKWRETQDCSVRSIKSIVKESAGKTDMGECPSAVSTVGTLRLL